VAVTGSTAPVPRADRRVTRRSTSTAVLVASAIAVLVASTLAVVVAVHPGPLPGELGYVQWWQDLGGPVPDLADLVWTVTGTEAALVVVAAAAALLTWSRGWGGVLAAAIAVLTMLVVQPGVKDIVDRPRPSPEVVDVRAKTESESFPSGHSMSTTTVWGAAAGAAWITRRRALAAVAAVPVALTFVAAAVLGVHWPTDSIAGTLLGATAACLIVRCVVEARSSP
jgi:membrane-associated phospholipid phosphatase